jgi:catechol 2,3-dioxygenase-like lactoylglutathione lyase family enzyme
MPNAIDHIALMVRDPARTAALYAQLFADAIITPGQEVGHHASLVQLGGTCFVLSQGEPPMKCNGDHIALTVSKAEQLICEARLKSLGIECQFARGGTALYFTDFDNHVFELDAEGGGVTS